MGLRFFGIFTGLPGFRSRWICDAAESRGGPHLRVLMASRRFSMACCTRERGQAMLIR